MLYSLGKRITDILFFQMDFRIGDIKSQVKHFLNSDFQKLLIAGCIFELAVYKNWKATNL